MVLESCRSRWFDPVAPAKGHEKRFISTVHGKGSLYSPHLLFINPFAPCLAGRIDNESILRDCHRHLTATALKRL